MDITIIKLLILALSAFLLGYLIGQRMKHTYGGEIIYEKKPDGVESCTIVMEKDDAWLSRQKFVVFRVEHRNRSTSKQ